MRANSVLGCKNRIVATRPREELNHFSLLLVRQFLEHCIWLWAPKYRKEMLISWRKFSKEPPRWLGAGIL